MKTALYLIIIVCASLALSLWLPTLLIHAADRPAASGIPEIMDTSPAVKTEAAGGMADPGSWVDQIRNALRLYQANYPSLNFTPYGTRLDLVQDALGRRDKRGVKTQMSAFFKMLAERDHGISEIVAGELTNIAQMVSPIEQYGITVPRPGAQ